MRGRFLSRPAILATALVLGGVVTSLLAFNAGDQRSGPLPAAIAPVGVWAVIATVCFSMAGGVLWTSAGRRMDASYANTETALWVVGALTNRRVMQRLRDAIPSTPRHLPTRISLVATRDGVEVWGRPGETRFLAVPWREIESVSAGTVVGMNRAFTALSFELSAPKPAFEIPVTGRSVTGLSSPTRSRVAELAAELMELKSKFDR